MSDPDELASQLLDLLALPVCDPDGALLGHVRSLYIDAGGQRPVFAAVALAGGRARRIRLVPLARSSRGARGLTVAFSAQLVRRAPRAPTGAFLTPNVEAVLYAHYGLPEQVSRGGHASAAAQAQAAAGSACRTPQDLTSPAAMLPRRHGMPGRSRLRPPEAFGSVAGGVTRPRGGHRTARLFTPSPGLATLRWGNACRG